jgi:hypothetical protein
MQKRVYFSFSMHFKIGIYFSLITRESNPITFNTLSPYFLHALILLKVEKLNRREMMDYTFSILQFSLVWIYRSEAFPRSSLST